MEATRNLCAQIPISLHDRVREERESLDAYEAVGTTA